ncbi:MAG: hypothetical protein LBV19_05490 [Streptococcaceae bacterium]|jgi:cytochrome bd-type quinol oxidase subunit 2|nr:hypothetical protein [Streptococcaceae bacterium]
MSISTLKKLTKASAIVSIVGALIVLALYIGTNIILKASGEKTARLFVTSLSYVLLAVVVISFVLGVLLFINLPKYEMPRLSGILLIVVAIIAWFYTSPLLAVLWIVVAFLLFRLEFKEDDSNNIQIIR